MLKKCSIAELGDDPVADLHQLRVVERHEVHREPGAHRLARLRMTEHDLAAVRDPVDRALAPGRELHHEQVGTALVRQQLDRLLETHRDRPRPLVQQLVRAVDGRVEDAEAARARREDGLEAHRPLRIAELARGGLDLPRAVHAPEVDRAHADAVQQLVRLRLVVRARDRVGLRHEHRHREAVDVPREPFEIERRLRQDRVDAFSLRDLEHRVGKRRIGAGGHDVERVAEVAADRALAHVGADEPHGALAVLAQPAQQRGRARRARRRHHDRQQLHERSILSCRISSSRAARSAVRNDSIDSRIVSPS